MIHNFGPVIEGGNVRFSLWAPDIQNVDLQLRDGTICPMTDVGDGWKEVVVPGVPGLPYQFRTGNISFPDPGSRLQQGGVHGWSIVTTARRIESWAGRPWRESVIYECHAGLLGGFRGVTAQLPELSALGITVLELMPIAAFPGTRNWGYDGVLPFAPAESYGTPDDLCELIIRAHELGISVILDVVYNHFGPDGNYLSLYAKEFFREDSITPWGPAFDFRKAEVRQFFSDNARYWLFEFGFDGLRFDAVHAIRDEGWLAELAGELRSEAAGRQIHLVLENEDNTARHLRSGFDAQWNDDMHHVLHVLLTGETQGYYRDFGEKPIALLARALGEGFIYQGQPSKNREGAPRGEPSADLPPTAFVSFLQNHDQTGNRALGERLTVLTDPRALKAAIALQLLAPQIPLIFMGEEIGSRTPFLYFTDHNQDLAQAVREGRAREFAAFAQASQSHPLPDPNVLETFAASVPQTNASDALAWRLFYRDLLALRQTQIATRLDGAQALSGEPIGEKAVLARWRMGDGKVLTLASNLGPEPVSLNLPAAQPFYGRSGTSLMGFSTLAWLE